MTVAVSNGVWLWRLSLWGLTESPMRVLGGVILSVDLVAAARRPSASGGGHQTSQAPGPVRGCISHYRTPVIVRFGMMKEPKACAVCSVSRFKATSEVLANDHG
jgi:hypothetical protein